MKEIIQFLFFLGLIVGAAVLLVLSLIVYGVYQIIEA
jgi:hypothetical protein